MRTSRGVAEWLAANAERMPTDQAGVRAGGAEPPELAQTSRMEFETRDADDGLGSKLLAVVPKATSVRKEDLLCWRAFHAADGATALGALDEALRLNPRHFMAIFNRSVIRMQADEPAAALRDLDHALALAGRDQHCLYNRAIALHRRGEYAAAIAALDEAIELAPARNATHFAARALSHRKRGEWRASIRDYATARSLVEAEAEEAKRRAEARRPPPPPSEATDDDADAAPAAAAADAPAAAAAAAVSSAPAAAAAASEEDGADGKRAAEDRAAALEAARTPPAQRTAEQLETLSELLGSMRSHGGGVGGLPREARLELCRTMGYVEAPPGTTVVTEGETGHSFYIVLFGELQVSQRRSAGGEGGAVAVERNVNIARLEGGAHFGELALLSEKGARRAASVRALLPCGLLCIVEAEYRRIVRGVQLQEMHARIEFLRTVPTFSRVAPERLLMLAGVLQPMVFERGAVVMKQGGRSTGMYIVQSGRLVAEREVAFDNQNAADGSRTTRTVTISELVRRDVCGELALLQPKRQIGVTIRVVSKASCLFLARADFSPQLLPDETLREMRLLSKLYSGDDMLRARHFQDQEWEKAKKVYVREVIREVRDRKDAERRKVGGWS